MEPYTFTQQLTEQEYVRTATALIPRRKTLLVLYTLVPLVFAVNIWRMIRDRSMADFPWPLLVILVGGFFVWFSFRHAVRKPYRASVFLQNPAIYTFDEAGISVVGTGISSRVEWTVLKKWQQIDDLLVLFNAISAVYMLKMDKLTPEVLDLIRRKVPLKK